MAFAWSISISRLAVALARARCKQFPDAGSPTCWAVALCCLKSGKRGTLMADVDPLKRGHIKGQNPNNPRAVAR